MADVELLVSGLAEFKIADEVVHFTLRSGSENLRFAMPILDFRGSIAEGQVELWKHDEARKNIVPMPKRGRRA